MRYEGMQDLIFYTKDKDHFRCFGSVIIRSKLDPHITITFNSKYKFMEPLIVEAMVNHFPHQVIHIVYKTFI